MSFDLQNSELTALVREIKLELIEVRKDIRSLNEQLTVAMTPTPKRAVITVPSIGGWEVDTIKLSVKEWAQVKRGEMLRVVTEDDFGGELLRSHWEFNGGIGGTVKRDVEWASDDIETEYIGTLTMNDIEEIEEARK